MTSLDEAIAAVMLQPVLDRVAADKSDAGQFDYNDMLQLVQAALHGPRGPELGARLRARTPWVMIDEFQDTDPVQWNIFRSVWMHEAARGLDDRRRSEAGDLRLPRRRRRDVRGGARRARCATARRASSSTSTAARPRRSSMPSTGSCSPTASRRCSITRSATTVPCVHVATSRLTSRSRRSRCFELAGPGKREEARVALAAAIGAEIDRLRGRGVSLGDCMVLTRTNADSAGVAAALRSRGLACALVEGDKLFETARGTRAPRGARTRSPRRAIDRLGCARCARASSTCRGPT